MIRPATADEAPVLTTIALDAKRYWGYPEHWIKHWESDLTISGDFIRDNHVYVAEDDGEIQGFYALCVAADKTELEHLWVKPARIGTGLGKELFLDAMERAAVLKRHRHGVGADERQCHEGRQQRERESTHVSSGWLASVERRPVS